MRRGMLLCDGIGCEDVMQFGVVRHNDISHHAPIACDGTLKRDKMWG
jgi:hypothetical protein